MENRIDCPKVFISYAWGNEDYQDKVLAFATQLMEDGIDVILDKWSLHEGNDTYAFMEKSVTDNTITNVLILLDPNYTKKADGRNGGVGTETQIISSEVYNKVDQEKFIPIVFEKDGRGEVCRPQYLKNLLYFDLSNEEDYYSEYQRLVKSLYGIKVIRKPMLGTKPPWVDEVNVRPFKQQLQYECLKKENSIANRNNELVRFLEDIKKDFADYIHDEENEKLYSGNDADYVALYKRLQVVRDSFLHLLKYSLYVPESYSLVANALEEISVVVYDDVCNIGELASVVLHEIFIYVIAFYMKNKQYVAVKYMLNKTYFVGKSAYDDASSFDIFFGKHKNLDIAISKSDKKQYFCGTARYWWDNVNLDVCSKDEFVFADILCYNASIFIENYKKPVFWFPLTYIYSRDEYNYSLFHKFSVKLTSKEHLFHTCNIMGFEDLQSFKVKFANVETDMKRGKFSRYRYSEAYTSAPLMCQFTVLDDLGIRN